MKAKEVHKLNDEEIVIELNRMSRKVFDLRCQVVTDKIEDPSQFKKIRRDIARLKTEQTVRLMAAQEASAS